MRITQHLHPDQVQADPFPLLIARNVLDPNDAQSLIDELPSWETMLKGVPYGSNERLNYEASDVISNPSVSRVWKELIQSHLEQAFLDEIISLFGPYIPKYYPDFESRIAPLDKLKAGIRNVSDESDAHVLLDAQIGVNTPTMGGTSVRLPHIDSPKKLFVGLLYLRLDGDESSGGDLVIYRAKSSPAKLDSTRTAELSDVEVVHTVPY